MSVISCESSAAPSRLRAMIWQGFTDATALKIDTYTFNRKERRGRREEELALPSLLSAVQKNRASESRIAIACGEREWYDRRASGIRWLVLLRRAIARRRRANRPKFARQNAAHDLPQLGLRRVGGRHDCRAVGRGQG